MKNHTKIIRKNKKLKCERKWDCEPVEEKSCDSMDEKIGDERVIILT